ncbi:MAG: hypothetical protein ABR987_12385 [Terracidiphilus sp.]
MRPIFIAAFLLSAVLSGRAALAATQDDLKTALDRLNISAASFRSTSAQVEFDNIETDPIPETDVQKGVVYYDRKNNSVEMGVHMTEHNGKPSGKAYTYVSGVFKLFEPGVNQVTTYVKASKWESYIDLGFGASGKDLEAKWDIEYLGAEQMGGVNTSKLELTPKDPALRKNLSKVTIWVDLDHAVSLQHIRLPVFKLQVQSVAARRRVQVQDERTDGLSEPVSRAGKV